MAVPRLKFFAEQYHIIGLSDFTLARLNDGHYDMHKADAFLAFKKRIEKEVLSHKVITDNPYTRWFSTADLNDAQVKYFIIQYSVFSNQLLVAQLHKMINAETIEEMHASKETLAHELGVLFTDKRQITAAQQAAIDAGHSPVGGAIEGGRFNFRAAHFELLVRLAEKLGLDFRLLGKTHRGKPSTLFLCNELIRLYGSDDTLTSTAASFVMESCASAGFWNQLVTGLNRYKASKHIERLPLAFFSWDKRLEANHALHTQEALERFYFNTDVDEEAFINTGNEMLDAVYTFWMGLYNDHSKLH